MKLFVQTSAQYLSSVLFNNKYKCNTVSVQPLNEPYFKLAEILDSTHLNEYLQYKKYLI